MPPGGGSWRSFASRRPNSATRIMRICARWSAISGGTARSGRKTGTSRWRYSLMNWGHDPMIKERAMKGYVDNIETATVANTDFRRVLYTGKHLQLVLMTLPPARHRLRGARGSRPVLPHRGRRGRDPYRRRRQQVSRRFRGDRPRRRTPQCDQHGRSAAEALHALRPAEHKDGVVHKTKEQAEADHANDEWNGETTE